MDITKANIEHAVLTQAHRWYQFYERNDRYIENQLDILTDQVFIKSVFDEGRDKAAYLERAANLPNWQNSHQIQSVAVERINKNTLALNMNILYQNVGYLPDNTLSNTHLNYSAKLQEGLDRLPKFSEIIISTNTTSPIKTYSSFQDRYPENRAKSLAHYWLFLIETRPKNIAYFKELFTDKLDLSLSSRHIHNSESFEKWIRETDSQVLHSGHTIARFDLTTVNSHEYEIEMEFEWRGYLQEQPDVEFEARTLHHWIIINNPSERFARIKSMNSRLIKNFQPCAQENMGID